MVETKNVRLYKYRQYTAQSLEIIINRELYFPSPQQLNDPYDCQFSIPNALQAAITSVDTIPKIKEPMSKKLQQFGKLEDIYAKMARDWEGLGVLSLSEVSDSALMWTHYADEHRGFCLGFDLCEPFTGYNEEHLVVGCTKVEYFAHNPFKEYFMKICLKGQLPDWEEFWMTLLSMGMAAKTEPWSYESEVRVLRKEPGAIPYESRMLSQVIFGSRMKDRQRAILRRLLSQSEWDHVKFSEMRKSERDLSFVVADT